MKGIPETPGQGPSVRYHGANACLGQLSPIPPLSAYQIKLLTPLDALTHFNTHTNTPNRSTVIRRITHCFIWRSLPVLTVQNIMMYLVQASAFSGVLLHYNDWNLFIWPAFCIRVRAAKNKNLTLSISSSFTSAAFAVEHAWHITEQSYSFVVIETLWLRLHYQAELIQIKYLIYGSKSDTYPICGTWMRIVILACTWRSRHRPARCSVEIHYLAVTILGLIVSFKS